jgi:hypothetical protein
MTDLEKTKLYYKKTQIFELLYEKCQEDRDFLADTIDQFINSLDNEKLNELDDFLVNNFGDD